MTDHLQAGRELDTRAVVELSAAVASVEQWHGDFQLRRQNGRWRATFFEPSTQHEAWADGPAAAICAAALKAISTASDSPPASSGEG